MTERRKSKENTSKVPEAKKKDTLIQALKFTLLSISAGGVEFLSFLILEAWSGLC